MSERNSGNMLAVTMLAGLAGAALALLWAPRSGRETRRQIGMKAGDLKDQAGESMDSLRTGAEDGLQRAREIKQRLSETLSRNKNKERNDSADSAQSPIILGWDKEV
jgi:gas vesicle protein